MSDTILTKLQRDGRDAYKQKDYQKALQCFNRAIGRDPSALLYDNRAACHAKLGDYPAALQDAKRAIKLHHEDPTGYLRAGKVLLEMQKDSVALEIYQHGCKKVRPVGRGYEMLKAAKEDLHTRLCPPNSVDPLTRFPPELAEIIFSHLSFQQRMNACFVSKPWRDYIRSNPTLWQHLDLRVNQRGKKIRNAFISRAINIARDKLTMATLSYLEDLPKALKALLQHCPITELTLLNTGLGGPELVALLRTGRSIQTLRLGNGAQIGQWTMRSVLDALTDRLEHFECTVHDNRPLEPLTKTCERLRILRLVRPSSTVWTPMLESLPAHAPNIQSLICHDLGERRGQRLAVAADFRGLKSLRTLDLRCIVPAVRFLKLPPSITSLHLAHTAELSFFEGLSETTFALPILDELVINIPRIKAKDIQHFLCGTSTAGDLEPLDTSVRCEESETPTFLKLRKLSIIRATLTNDCLSAILSHPRLSDLESLTLQPYLLGQLDDTGVKLIADELRKLRFLDISGTAVTGVGVKDLVGTGHIDHIVLNNCGLLGRDAVDWARLMGVKVEYTMQQADKHGKKIRYGP
ncbi:Ubiquitination Target receptor [Teratosphaeria destructans]|uniref:Ubiquitination Target receptor n=1 Tax=Teratosphaeria destructans TaxID=418781 RepID=A0A9W7SZP1_9PEZI|nr:Ubiquitination Target receptor [Teratosphaeria destructans]